MDIILVASSNHALPESRYFPSLLLFLSAASPSSSYPIGTTCTPCTPETPLRRTERAWAASFPTLASTFALLSRPRENALIDVLSLVARHARLFTPCNEQECAWDRIPKLGRSGDARARIYCGRDLHYRTGQRVTSLDPHLESSLYPQYTEAKTYRFIFTWV